MGIRKIGALRAAGESFANRLRLVATALFLVAIATTLGMFLVPGSSQTLRLVIFLSGTLFIVLAGLYWFDISPFSFTFGEKITYRIDRLSLLVKEYNIVDFDKPQQRRMRWKVEKQ